MQNIRELTWNEFNDCVQKITELLKEKKIQGVYGFPRGGLCLAVAISHSLNVPLLDKPEPNSLIVDDIYDSGKTINSIREIKNIEVFVWISRVNPSWWKAYEIDDSKEWFVFPWEKMSHAKEEKDYYSKSRKERE